MNDGMANTVTGGLTKVHRNSKGLVTGQDAEVAGIRNILKGDQSMTVYKPIKKLAASVGPLVAAIRNSTDTSSLASAPVKSPNGTASIKSILKPLVRADLSNIQTNAIAD